MDVRIIANPISGGGRGQDVARALYTALEAHGLTPELIVTRQAGDAEREAARPGADCVVAVGGDGTVNEVANGLRGSSAALALVPLGTANAVAKELRIPRDPGQVARLIVTGSTRCVDVGLHNGRRFLQSAGAGFDAAVVQSVHARRGARLGIARYVPHVLETLRTYAYPPICVTVDGTILCEDAHYVVLGNCRRSAGLFSVTPDARIDDGVFDVCAARDLRVLRLAVLAAATFRAGFAQRNDIYYTKGREVTYESLAADPVPLQIDGDPAGYLPATFTLDPAALNVIAPTG